MICVKYKRKVIGSIYYASNKNTVVGFSVEICLPKPTTAIIITEFISYTCEYFYVCHRSFSVVGAFSESLSEISRTWPSAPNINHKQLTQESDLCG